MDETMALDLAEVRFDGQVDLETGHPTRFSVTLRRPGLPPSPSEAPSQGRVRVACIVEARLVAPHDALAVSPDGWSSDRYVPPDATKWSWMVQAGEPGQVDAVIELRPAILVEDGSGAARRSDLGTVEFSVRFAVTRSASDTAGLAWAWIAGGTGFVVAVLAIPSAYYAFRQHRAQQQPIIATRAKAAGKGTRSGLRDRHSGGRRT